MTISSRLLHVWRLPSQLSLKRRYSFRLAQTLVETITDQDREYGDNFDGPARRLSAPTMQLLFGGDHRFRALPPIQLERQLPALMIMSVYRSNVKYIQDRLDQHRHGAIQDPNLETFQPLALLRQNIADMQDELREKRQSFGVSRSMSFFDSDQGKYMSLYWEPPESVAWDFRALLEKLEDMSKTLDHELELVIGSVTIQVFHIFHIHSFPLPVISPGTY